MVRPAAPECDRTPPRRLDEMSWVEVLLAVRDSPARARSLFTVLAAISVARLGLWPRRWALSLMCSYWRSRFGLAPRGTGSLLPDLTGSRPALRFSATRVPGRKPALVHDLSRQRRS